MPPPSTAAAVSVVVLGTVQDGGVPHPCCECPRCVAASKPGAPRRFQAAAALVGQTGRVLLIDATPSISDQLCLLAKTLGRPCSRPDAIVITHAHIGHYLGLAFLGREALAVKDVPVYGTPSVIRFFRGNRPWSHLADRGEIDLRVLAPGSPLAFDGALVHAFLTPHRGEDTDTLGFEIHGPRRRLVYVTDADVFPPEIVERIHDADVSLVDGTFFHRKELPHRDILEVKHPFVSETIKRLDGARGKVYFTHLNHTNPLLDAESPERHAMPAGFSVAIEGQQFAL